MATQATVNGDGATDASRIFILGIGNVGRLFAHSIGKLPQRPPVTLLLHRPSLAEEFEAANRSIELSTNGVSDVVGGYDYEVVDAEAAGSAGKPLIHNLIVTTKATQTLAAISRIKNRLNAHSTVVFTQNGMGTTDLISQNLFPDPASRPLYMTGVIFHGIHSTGPFSTIHAGVGYVPIAPPHPKTYVGDRLPDQHVHLLSTILAVKAVNAIEVPPAELLLIQLVKLVVNCLINPLTALFGIRNKGLYEVPALAPLVDVLITETRAVILALPELKPPLAEVPREEVERRFSMDALRTLVREKALMTGENRSSMLADADAGRETEIEFINGWVVRKGRELGVEVPISEKAVEFVLQRRYGKVDVGRDFGL
jgi:2-dehydropantoate 2-reductase